MIRFSEKLKHLRLSANLMYDTAIASGKPGEEIIKILSPIQRKLEQAIRKAAEEDLPGVVFAIKSMENEQHAISRDIAILNQKWEDTGEHIEKLKDALKKNLRKHKTHRRMVDGSSATLVGETITVR